MWLCYFTGLGFFQYFFIFFQSDRNSFKSKTARERQHVHAADIFTDVRRTHTVFPGLFLSALL